MDIALLLSTQIPAYFAIGPLCVLLLMLLVMSIKSTPHEQTPLPAQVPLEGIALHPDVSSGVVNAYVAPPPKPIAPLIGEMHPVQTPPPVVPFGASVVDGGVSLNPPQTIVPPQVTPQSILSQSSPVVAPTPIATAPISPQPVVPAQTPPPIASWKPVPQAPVGDVPAGTSQAA